MKKEITTTKTYTEPLSFILDLINNHYNTINRKNGGVERTVLSYYILYGISKETDEKIIDECFPSSKNKEDAKQSISNIKTSLKQADLINYNSRQKLYTVNPPLNLTVEDKHIFYGVNFKLNG